MKAMKVLLILVVLAPMTSFAKMPKVSREDFSNLITDGMKSSTDLSMEIRKSLGVAPDRQENKETQAAINSNTIVLEMGGVDQVHAPTTKFVRARPVQLDLEDLNDRRVAEEFEQAGY